MRAYHKNTNSKCKVDNCTLKEVTAGYCNAHYKKWKKYANPLESRQEIQKGKICKARECMSTAFSKGYCSIHYDSVKKHNRDYLILSPRGTGTVTKDGYREFNINGVKILEHIMVAEKALGKKLPLKAVIHHFNENKLDNSPGNLVICPNQAYHMLLHKRMRDFDKDKVN